MTCLLSVCRIISARIAPDASDEQTRACALELAGVLVTVGLLQPPARREAVRARSKRKAA